MLLQNPYVPTVLAQSRHHRAVHPGTASYDRCHHFDTTRRPAVPHLDIVDALLTGRIAAARAITFEYLALTQGAAGLPVPQDIAALPGPLRAVLDTLAQRHAPPGALLLAQDEESVCGTVALSRSRLTAETDAVVQRLYVRADYRHRGIARELMAQVHAVALREGFERTVLSVLTSRKPALALYRSLGYQPMATPDDWAYGGVWLQRRVSI
jgi:ribosomal protein S18 acetylase RimI-like enzyme